MLVSEEDFKSMVTNAKKWVADLEALAGAIEDGVLDTGSNPIPPPPPPPPY